MKTRAFHQILCLLLSLALLTGGLASSAVLAQSADEPPPPTGIRFDAPYYAVDGPYAVGVRYFTIPAENENDRELTASIWYPALNPEGAAGGMVYEQQFEPGQVPPFSVLGHALLDAEPDESGGPYPLIVYSHAHWSMAQEIPYFVEHLASHGFVIISADHQDNWSTFPGPMAYQAVVRRSQEVSRKIDFAEELSMSDSSLSGMIATERVGIAGWSRGGVTAWSAAGARLDLPNLRSWCTADPLRMESPNAGLSAECVDILEHEAEMAEFDGLDEVPSGLWPSWQDERIVAAIPLSGRTASFGSEGIAHVNVPVLMFHGSHEAQIVPGLVLGNPYENMGSPRKASVVFEHAGHGLYNSSCAAIPDLAAMFPGFCIDPVWDTDRAHDLINHFSTAFLLAELKGNEEAAASLAAENVDFLGIEYREKGYGAAPEATPQRQGLRPDAPEFAVRGPHWIGYRSVAIGVETDRPLDAGLWYPALNPGGDGEEITYASTLKVPLGPLDSPLVVDGHALRGAEADPAAAPYPLVIFSPGFSVDATMYSALIEHLTSHGFVVIAPEHLEQFDPEYGDLWTASIDRPQDVKQTLDYAEQISAQDGILAGLIDMQKVAVAGHSYGGYTALALAGAQYDLDAFNQRCAGLSPDDPNAFLCAPLVPNEEAMAERAGLDAMPDGLWPSFGDPRVTAILPIAGDSYLFDKAGLAKVTLPMMAIGGTADTSTPYEWGSKPAYDNVASARKALVTLNGAEHMIPIACDNNRWIGETPFYAWVCFDPVWDKNRGLDLINHFATAFLLAELKGDSEAAAALAAENVDFLGIEYKSAGYEEVIASTSPPVSSPATFAAVSESEFTSDALAGNLLGDPVTRKFVIYLPPSYSTSERRYPVVYALHGFTGDQRMMSVFQEEVDRLIQDGEISEMIVVMPDASNTYRGSFYMNSPTIGDYETYISEELVEWVDVHYRTIPQAEARGITGCSMGGLGAVRLGLQFSDVFGVIAGVSGPYLKAYHRMPQIALGQIQTIPQTLADFVEQPFAVQAIFAIAAAAAPNPDNPPFYLDVPFANADSEFRLVEEVFERFDAVYASAALEGYPTQDMQSQAILLYHGDEDPMADVEGARVLSAMLTEKGVVNEYLEVSGGHCNLDYSPVVQFMAQHLVFETP